MKRKVEKVIEKEEIKWKSNKQMKNEEIARKSSASSSRLDRLLLQMASRVILTAPRREGSS
jgi:hypothetical protein